ncbi:hypothetical protein BMR85_028205 [Achromobacter sp. KAs 3-5]|nr:hypothetical protein BMR85_028205 [Achromobacter sp. KAs 3-5]
MEGSACMASKAGAQECRGALEIAVPPSVMVEKVGPEIIGPVDEREMLIHRMQRVARDDPAVQGLGSDHLHRQADGGAQPFEVAQPIGRHRVLPRPDDEHPPRQLDPTVRLGRPPGEKRPPGSGPDHRYRGGSRGMRDTIRPAASSPAKRAVRAKRPLRFAIT